MPGHIAMVLLSATVAAVPPAHAAHRHVPLRRHIAAASSFGPPPRVAVAHRHRHRHRATVRVPTARSASDPAVAIANFHFTPPTTTVHVGDTVTWTNDGPSPHTATAQDGSFNTGTLSKGQSASHTFTKPGSYAYVCTIHPFMHGTITVLAAAAAAPTPAPAKSSTPSTTTGTTSPRATSTANARASVTATTARAATAKPSLPVTGSDVLGPIAVGAMLFGCGLALRRAVRP